MPKHSSTVGEEADDGIRLDRYVAEKLGLLPRSQLKPRGLVAEVNGKAVKISRRLFPGDKLDLEWKDSAPSELEPQDIPLRILYEDARVVVIDKEQGLVVHPGAGNRSGTLANAVLFRKLRADALSPRSAGLDSGGVRPGIVHRLDKDTSGVIIAAYDDRTLAFLAEQFKSRTTRKTYLAIAVGAPAQDEGTISTFIARDSRDRKRFAVSAVPGKAAVTQYRVLRRFEGFAFLALRPKTGRTHQLRVHMKHLGCPILGDPIYGGKSPAFPNATLALHAFKLTIRLPLSAEPKTFRAPLPERFRKTLRILRAKAAARRPRGR